MEKSGGQRTNNTFRDIALEPTGRQHPTQPNSKPPALIPTLKKKRSTESENKIAAKQLLRWSHKTYQQDQGAINLAQISPHN